MKFHIVLSTAAAVMIVVHTAAADEPINDLPLEQREAYAEQALDFVQCAGMHHAAGDVGREVGVHPDDIELAEGLGRGWSLAAEMLVALAMPDPRQAGSYAQDPDRGGPYPMAGEAQRGGEPSGEGMGRTVPRALGAAKSDYSNNAQRRADPVTA